MTESERQQIGFAAKIAVHDEALKAGLSALEQDIHSEWASCWTERGRERCYRDLKALKRLREKLAQLASNAPRD